MLTRVPVYQRDVTVFGHVFKYPVLNLLPDILHDVIRSVTSRYLYNADTAVRHDTMTIKLPVQGRPAKMNALPGSLVNLPII